MFATLQVLRLSLSEVLGLPKGLSRATSVSTDLEGELEGEWSRELVFDIDLEFLLSWRFLGVVPALAPSNEEKDMIFFTIRFLSVELGSSPRLFDWQSSSF